MTVNNKNSAVQDQVLAALAQQMEDVRLRAMNSALNNQDKALAFALEQIEAVKKELKDPTNFLGRMDTKHGEVAEKIEIAIRNAREALNQNVKNAANFSATFEGVGRTAPEDYIIDGIEVQSKFINGLNNNLKHVIDHMEKYDQFGRDGSYYHIPKDTHEQIQKILDGESIDGIKSSTIDAVKDKVRQIEGLSGKSFSEVVQSGESTYDEVQLYKADGTLDSHSSQLKSDNQNKTNDIKADDAYKASIEEAGKAALAGAAIGAGISFVSFVYQKNKEGKNLFKGDFKNDDWKELGIDTGKAALIGGLSGGVLYGLTNYAGMAAPFAGAVVTAAKSMASLSLQYKEGELTLDEFIDLSFVSCAESATVGLASMIGQTLIPIPIVGSLIGSMTGKFCIDLLKSSDKKVLDEFNKRINEFTDNLNVQEKRMLHEIETRYIHLANITTAAFNFENNETLLNLSVQLAREHSVPEELIIKSTLELDDFMMM